MSKKALGRAAARNGVAPAARQKSRQVPHHWSQLIPACFRNQYFVASFAVNLHLGLAERGLLVRDLFVRMDASSALQEKIELR
jgi:hypothetical protein